MTRLFAIRSVRPARPARLAGRLTAFLATIALAAGGLGGCTSPILANAPVARPSPPATPAPPPSPHDPQPVVLPRDDGPHDRLTEWWYYTGHLRSADGRRFGFELVIFRAERGAFPVSWASHLAVTDESGNSFHYAQRSEIGPQVDMSPRSPDGTPSGFALSIRGLDPTNPATAANPAWSMRGARGHDRLSATLAATEATAAGAPRGLGFDLSLSATKPPALHLGSGWIGFGPAGGSYYYSRTRMAATGTLDLDGRKLAVTGDAWFDHQWGDFIAVGGGGWDWFAVNLNDGTDLMLFLIRDATGRYPLAYGSVVGRDGTVTEVGPGDFTVHSTGSWTSPHTGGRYPSGWRIELPRDELVVDLTPTVADQELDTRPTTGVAYWEGSQRVTATRGGVALGGEAYVELTGYAPTK